MLSGQVLGFDFLNFQVGIHIMVFEKSQKYFCPYRIRTIFVIYPYNVSSGKYCFFLAALMNVCLWKTVEYTSQIQMLRYDFIKESAPI